MPLSTLLGTTGPTGFSSKSTAEDVTEGLDLSGKNILITGCNSGLGYETMRILTQRGARVLGCARSQEKAQTACDSVDGLTEPFVCELADPHSVLASVEAVRESGHTIDALICNAGIMAIPKLETIQGYEKQFFVNHVGHFILVRGLLDQLRDNGRVVMVSSYGHTMAPRDGIQFDNLDGEKRYSAWRAYGQSKLANLLFAKSLARRFSEDDTNRIAHAIHPGVINTELGRHMNGVMQTIMSMGKFFYKSTPQGAATQVYAAVHPDAAARNGEYYTDCNIAQPSKNARDPELADALWEKTEAIVAELTG